MFKVLSALSKVPVEALEKVTAALTQFAVVTDLLADEKKMDLVQKNLVLTISVVGPVLGEQFMNMLDDPRCRAFLVSPELTELMKQVEKISSNITVTTSTSAPEPPKREKQKLWITRMKTRTGPGKNPRPVVELISKQ